MPCQRPSKLVRKPNPTHSGIPSRGLCDCRPEQLELGPTHLGVGFPVRIDATTSSVGDWISMTLFGATRASRPSRGKLAAL